MVESNPPYNNSANRIISKEEEREDPRRELQSSFQLESKSVSTYNARTLVFSHAIQSSCAKKTILYTELILLQEFSKKNYNYKAHPVQQGSSHADRYKASSNKCSLCIQAFYMAGA